MIVASRINYTLNASIEFLNTRYKQDAYRIGRPPSFFEMTLFFFSREFVQFSRLFNFFFGEGEGKRVPYPFVLLLLLSSNRIKVGNCLAIYKEGLKISITQGTLEWFRGCHQHIMTDKRASPCCLRSLAVCWDGMWALVIDETHPFVWPPSAIKIIIIIEEGNRFLLDAGWDQKGETEGLNASAWKIKGKLFHCMAYTYRRLLY